MAISSFQRITRSDITTIFSVWDGWRFSQTLKPRSLCLSLESLSLRWLKTINSCVNIIPGDIRLGKNSVRAAKFRLPDRRELCLAEVSRLCASELFLLVSFVSICSKCYTEVTPESERLKTRTTWNPNEKFEQILSRNPNAALESERPARC